MKFDLRNFSIKTQAFIIFGALALLAIINFLVTNSISRDFQSASAKIDVIGRTRMLSQRIALVSNRIHEGEDDLKGTLKKTIENQNDIFEAFYYGGQLPGHASFIEPVSGASKASLSRTMENWKIYKVNLEIFLGIRQTTEVEGSDNAQKDWDVATSQEEALIFINKNAETLLSNCKELVQVMVMDIERKRSSLNNTLTIFFIFNLIILGAITYTLINYFLKPLRGISNVAERISRGDLETISDYNFTNEVGNISGALNTMVKSLNNATAYVEKIGEGNLDEQYSATDNENEDSENSLIQALLKMREQMKEVRQEEEKRKWATEGFAVFADILRSTDVDLHELGNRIVAKLVEYSGSNQGGLYLLNEEGEKKLELIALYAYERRKYEERDIRLGEGLVGQTFLEKKTTLLLEIPEDYIRIGSGLGDAEPKSIIIVPLMINEEIYGIIELASFHKFEPYQIQFVEKLAENIASTISGVKTNQRTKKLLEESQQLTEQMQSQEEEMRQNMEELTATQEEMQRTELEFFAQQTAINANIGIAEFSMDGRFISANAMYAIQLGYSKDDLTDMFFAQVTLEAGLWDKLVSGNEVKGWYEKVKRTGEQVKVQSVFMKVKTDTDDRIVELITEFNAENVNARNDELGEVEDMLRQQLEELSITQEQLDQQVKMAESRFGIFENDLYYVLCDDDGHIHHVNNKTKSAFNIESKTDSELNINFIFERIVLNEEEKSAILKAHEAPVEIIIKSLPQQAGGETFLVLWSAD